MEALVDMKQCYDVNTPVSMGTTIIAVSYNGGVIVGTDSRTSSGTYVVNRVTDKITDIDSHIVCLRSGSAADTQFLANQVKYLLEFNKLLKSSWLNVYVSCFDRYHCKAPEHVRLAACIFRNMCYRYRNVLSAGIIVAGYDESNGAQIYSIALGGMLTKLPFAIGGSGSIFLYSYFDQHYHENMTQEECIELVLKALSHAIYRDGSSGGVARLAVITRDGIERRIVPNNILPVYL